MLLSLLYININGQDITLHEVPVDGDSSATKATSTSSGVTVDAIDSDYFLIYTKPSTLPVEGVGMGVFTRDVISANNIICEYRGPIVAEEDKKKFPYNDKYFNIEVDNEGYSILGEGICAMINDCSNALELLNNNSSLVNESLLISRNNSTFIILISNSIL